jgi:iron complex outermembrane recepter protein
MKDAKILLFSAFTLALAAPGNGYAAESAAAAQSGDIIEEIVVTAQRRTENVQKTALSIEVFSGDELRQAGITKPDDLIKLAPGVQVAGGTTTQIYVRGVGDFGVTATANPAIVTSIDGVSIGRPQAISGNFFDIERIEILKGPQGTLYGRNASGGALNILTVQPKLGEYSGYADATFGNFSQSGVEGAFNVPAGQRGAFRLSYQVNSRDGYLSDGGDDDKHQSVRLQSKFEASDKLSIRTMFGYTHLGGMGTGLVPVPKLPGLSAWSGDTSAAVGDAYVQAATNNFVFSGGASPPPFLIANPKDSKLFQDVTSYNAGLQLDYQMDFATLTVIPAYRHTGARFSVQPSFLYNVGGNYDANGDRTNGERTNQYSLEARLAHESDKLKWVIGAYGYQENQSTDYALQGGLILNTRNEMDLKTEAAAGFGQLTYSFTEAFRLTGGVRYTRDKRSASNYQLFAISPMVLGSAPSPFDCVPPNGALPGTLCPLTNPTPGFYDSSVTFNKATWKAGVEFDLAPQSMLFADVSTGFKAGGFNQAVSLTDPTKLQPYDPETVTAYMLGVKNRFLENKLQLNVEAFYLDYKDMQLSAQAIDGAHAIVLLTQNAGKARIAGGNIDVVMKPWRGGTIHGAVEYVDSDYKEFIIQQLAFFVPPGRTGCNVSAPNAQGLVTIDCSGKQLVRTPKVSGNAGFTQAFELGSGGNVSLETDVAFAGQRYLATDFVSAQLADSYANVSASLTYNAPGDKWYVGAFGRNLTNAEIFTGGGGHQSGFVTGWSTSNIAPPRTYGVRLGVKF